jgi:hypothetical protein
MLSGATMSYPAGKAVKMARVPRAKSPEERRQVSVNIPAAWVDRIAALADRLSPEPGIAKVTSSDVLRMAIARGLDTLEGLPTPRRVRAAKPR